jgi:hypothetical protein
VTLAVHQKAEVGEEICTNDGAGYVGDDKTPREISAQSQVEAERQPAISMDGSAVSRAEVIVDTGAQMRCQRVGKTQRLEPVSMRNR